MRYFMILLAFALMHNARAAGPCFTVQITRGQIQIEDAKKLIGEVVKRADYADCSDMELSVAKRWLGSFLVQAIDWLEESKVFGTRSRWNETKSHLIVVDVEADRNRVNELKSSLALVSLEVMQRQIQKKAQD